MLSVCQKRQQISQRSDPTYGKAQHIFPYIKSKSLDLFIVRDTPYTKKNLLPMCIFVKSSYKCMKYIFDSHACYS